MPRPREQLPLPLPASPVVTSVPLLCRESVHAAIKAGKEIGSGGFGHIVLCTLEGMQVVVKRANDNKHADALVAREAFMLSSLAAPLGQPAANIVKVLGVSYAPAKADSTAWQPVLVLEYCSKGSLHDYSRAPDGHIHTQPARRLGWHGCMRQAWCTATSSLPTSSSGPAVQLPSPTSAWRCIWR